MLSTCFGVAAGIVIAGWVIIVKGWIDEFREKRRKRKEEQETTEE
jgi:hypothetical protein